MPVRVLAMRMADLAQVWTHNGRRAMAGMMILCAVDDEAGPQLYKVDRRDIFRVQGCGSRAQVSESMTRLEKRVKEDGVEHDVENTVRHIIMELQAVLSTDFKATEIEVGERGRQALSHTVCGGD